MKRMDLVTVAFQKLFIEPYFSLTDEMIKEQNDYLGRQSSQRSLLIEKARQFKPVSKESKTKGSLERVTACFAEFSFENSDRSDVIDIPFKQFEDDKIMIRKSNLSLCSNSSDILLNNTVSNLKLDKINVASENSLTLANDNEQAVTSDSRQIGTSGTKHKDIKLAVATHQTEDSSQLMKELNAVKQEMTQTVGQLQTANNDIHQLQMKVSSGLKHLAMITETEREMVDMEMRLQGELETLQRRRFEVQEESNLEKAKLNQSFSQLRKGLSSTVSEVQHLKSEHKKLALLYADMPVHMNMVITITTKKICEALHLLNSQNEDLVRKYKREMQLRKKYHNELVELRGNIRVFCRVRPPINEDGPNVEQIISVDNSDDAVVHVQYKGRLQTFELDRVFSPHVSQEEVFQEIDSLVTSCIDGYNVCIFAYGQTGSGKTYTMEGSRENPGINQRALQLLFDETWHRSSEWITSISVSMIEIYNEAIRDLLSTNATSKLEIKMAPEGGLYVQGLTTCDVVSVNDVNEILNIGHQNRVTASTGMNERSSRSHALLCVDVVSVSRTTGMKTFGKLNLVDLAGSERVSKSGAGGDRLKEAQNINRSLASLGDVIHALRSKQAHIPYRNSKLTYLLQDSLGGDSKTLMIVQVAPVEKNVGETVASLNFAQRVNTVELGQASKRTECSDRSDRVTSNETCPSQSLISKQSLDHGAAKIKSNLPPRRLKSKTGSCTPSRSNSTPSKLTRKR